MSNAFFEVPMATNEPVLPYGPGSPEKQELKKALADLKSKSINIPMRIGGKKVTTKEKVSIHPPHEHQRFVEWSIPSAHECRNHARPIKKCLPVRN